MNRIFKGSDKSAAALAALAGKEGRMSFDDVRAALGADEKALPDGSLHQIAMDAGFVVDGAGRAIVGQGA